MNESAELKSIPVSQIDFGRRARQNYQKIDVLMEDIKLHGLISPIAVLSKADAGNLKEIDNQLDDSKPYLLLAGGRRFTAHINLGREFIDAKIYTRFMNEEEVKVIELHENIHRENLTWTEECMLTDEIHSLQIKLFGEKISKSADAPGHSIRDTAKMLDKSHTAVNDDIKLAKAIKAIPELAKEKTKNDAMKKLEKYQKDANRNIQVKKIEQNKNSEDFSDKKRKLMDSYNVMDALEFMKSLPNRSVSLVEIDPPYAIDLENEKKTGNDIMTYNEWDNEMYKSLIPQILIEAERVLKVDGFLLFWFGPEPWFEETFKMISDAKFIAKRMPAIWNRSFGQTKSPQFHLANVYEMFFYARKSNLAAIKAQGRGNIFNVLPTHPTRKWHSTQKPVALMREIYKTFNPLGGKIAIPFLGSGVGILAAYEEHMEAVGSDNGQIHKDKFVEFVNNWDGKKSFVELTTITATEK